MTAPYAEVIGDPIAHSKSPLIHGFWLERLGIAADYRACHVRPDELASYVAARRADPAWRGCNITVPHKQAARALVDRCDPVAARIGAINLIFRDADGALTGTNTDAAGFADPLAAIPLAGAPVALIGAGGAARAVLDALAARGVGPITILNRTPEKAAALLAEFALQGEALPLDAPLPPAALLVNSSTLGMTGQPAFAPDLASLPATAIVYDLVYAPLETPLLAAARARGLATIDGLAMLIGQAARAFERLFGAGPPRDRASDAELKARLTR